MPDLPDRPIPPGGIALYGRRLRRGDVRALEAVETYLTRIRALDDRLGAFAYVDPDRARTAAAGIDGLIDAGVDLGPLMGVPVAIKDLFAVAGMPTRAGSTVDVTDCIGPEGAFVRALKAAGCIVLGKTRTTEFAAGCLNQARPMPWNPWDARQQRSPGGSSHGSAVATAAGLCAFAVGSDTGGSVRQPAAFNGVYGLKPTAGTWPLDGVFPLSPAMDTPGLFCASADDLHYVASALGIRVPDAAPHLSGRRLAVTYPPGVVPDAAVRARFEDAIGRIQAAGAEVARLDWPAAEEMAEVQKVFAELVATDLLATLGEPRIEAAGASLDPVAVRRLAAARGLSAVAYVTLDRRRRALARGVTQRLSGYDALVTPTAPDLPGPLADLATDEAADDHIRRVLHYTRPTNVYDQCALSVPDDGGADALPMGLQITCPHGDDGRLVALASSLSQALAHGGRPASPPLTGFTS